MDIVLFVILLIAIIWDVFKCKDEDRTEFGIDNTNTYKGFCALLIILHHITQQTDAKVFLYFGYLGVGGFMFISGYGMSVSFKIKEDKYSKEIICKKIPELLAMCIFTMVYMALYYMALGRHITLNDIVGIQAENSLVNWYFRSIILIYILFAISIKLAKNNAKLLLIYMSIFVTLYTLILCVLWQYKILGSHWVLSNFAYIGGMYMAFTTCKKIILKYLLKYRIVLAGFTFILFIVFNYCWRGIELSIISKMIRMSGRMMVAVLFAFVLFGYFTIYKSKRFFMRIGTYSAEMILVQDVALSLWKSEVINIQNDYCYILLFFLSELLLVYILSPIYGKIKKIVSNFTRQHDLI